MKKIVFAAALSAGLLAFGDIGEFAKKVSFTIEYEGAGSLSGIPVLVKLAANSPVGFNYSECAADGSDIRFTDANGEAIPFEIDTWNTEGESLVWVKPTSLAKGTNFTMHFCGTPAEANDPTAVWTEYTGVWHLNELGEDTTDNSQGLYPNSTAVAGIDGHLSPSNSVAGALGRFGQSFLVNSQSTGPKDDYRYYGGVWVNDSGAESPLDAGDKFVISGWFKHRDFAYYYDNLFSKGGKSEKSFMVQMSASKNTTPTLKAYGSADKTTQITYPTNMLDSWAYLTFVYDDTSCSIYENGVLVDAVTITKTVDNNKPLVFGNNPNIVNANCKGDATWLGWIDEVRFAKGVQSAEWIAAEYAAMTDDGFVTAGEVETSALPVLGNVTVTADVREATISGAIVSCGAGASACDVYLAIGPSETGLGAARKIASAVTVSFSAKMFDLSSHTTYIYELSVTNNATPALGSSVRGSFTTEPCFDFRRRVTFTVGYEAEGSDAFLDIPVLVKLAANSPAGFRYSDCAADGSDVRFVDADNNLIPFEIDTWDPRGESIIWVKPASIAKGTTFTMYYKGKADLKPDPKAAWTGYSGVWHFSELADDTADYSQGLYPNSTASEGIDAHLSTKSIPNETGKFGKTFRSNDSSGLKQGNWNEGGAWVVDAGTDSPIDSDNGKLTVSCWVKHQDWKNAVEKIVYKRFDSDNVSDPINAFLIEAQSSTYDFMFAAKASASARARDEIAEGRVDPRSDWVHLAAVYDSSNTILLYVNGVHRAGKNYIAGVTDNDAPLVFGNNVSIANGETGASAWAGWIDEVRYLKGAKSAEWIAAEYAAMTDDAFLTAGEVEKINPPGLMILVR